MAKEKLLSQAGHLKNKISFKRLLIYFSLVLLILAGAFTATKFRRARDSKVIFFEEIAIVKYDRGKIPCIQLKIFDQIFLAKLDLGFYGHASLAKELLEGMRSKQYVRNTSFRSLVGKKYETKIYKIPELSIGTVDFFHPLIEETNRFFEEDTSFAYSSQEEDAIEESIGWCLFAKGALYLDFTNSKIVLCDSIDTFKNHKYSLDGFVKLPLSLKERCIAFDVKSESRMLKCMLDTGCTVNLVHVEFEEEKTFEDLLENESIRMLPIKMGKTDLGLFPFQPCPVKRAFQVDAVLGMHFLRHHQIFIDFRNRQIYFSRPKL